MSFVTSFQSKYVLFTSHMRVHVIDVSRLWRIYIYIYIYIGGLKSSLADEDTLIERGIMKFICQHHLLGGRHTSSIDIGIIGSHWQKINNRKNCVIIWNFQPILVYIYIVIHRQTVSLYHNSSVWLDRLDSRSWDRNLVDWHANPSFYHSASRKPA